VNIEALLRSSPNPPEQSLQIFARKNLQGSRLDSSNATEIIDKKDKIPFRERRGSPLRVTGTSCIKEMLIQAVVLCDVDSNRFEPLSKERHPILFPLAGTPILAYTLEFLERGGVEEIILICSTLVSQVRSYLE